MKRNFIAESPRIRTKINFILFNSIVLLVFVLSGYNYFSQKADLIDTIETKLLSDIDLSRAYIEAKYPGEWAIIDGDLHKGTVNLVGNTEIVDVVGELTKGNYVSIFQDDVRISTNIEENGQRAINTNTLGEITSKVLGNKERYTGFSEVEGESAEAVYDPILNTNGEVVGMWSTAISTAPYGKIAFMHMWKKKPIEILLLVLTISVISLYVEYKVSRPLKKIQENANELAELNLNGRVLEWKGNDEIARVANSFNAVQVRLKETIGVVANSATQVASASQILSESSVQTSEGSSQIAKTINEIAGGASQQSNQIEGILRMLGETILEVNESLREAEETLVTATESTTIAKEGQAAISDAIKHLSTVTQTVSFATESIQKLGKRSEEIGGIITVITSIADQTNLLALNAAIEAARAGEHGKGFAVVAEEVRALAEQSRLASGQITELIGAIQAETSVTVRTMESNLLAVEEQVMVINKGGDALVQIVDRVAHTEANVAHMHEAFNQVYANSTDVQRAMQDISAIIEGTAAASEQVAATAQEQTATMAEITANAEDLAQIADSLQQEVQKFKLS
ncbi:methyl-accepting chemotaxis protein [Solibacillus sp. FSL H8-0523]|uniref:methyl-accepting chemotaxis protein n=1 Tax=unclassified Solibacillus TaxID=2637870 RepID=UPI0031019519